MSPPRASLGLPVRNGEHFLERQLESLAAQSFEDYTLIISDNGSTDATEQICREFAARDPRIRYHRSHVDHGLAWNWNRVFDLSDAPYFKWVAHDDEHAPEFLSRCIGVLDADPSVVCCHSASLDIDDHGQVIRLWPARTLPASSSPHVRFADMLRPYPAFQNFGVMRVDALRRTGLHRPFPSSDLVLLAELSLQGRLVEVPEPLFRRREHAARSVRAFPTARARRALYAGASSKGPRLPALQLTVEMVRAVHHSPVTGRERLLCWLALRRWLWRDVRHAGACALRWGLVKAGRDDLAVNTGLLEHLRRSWRFSASP